MDKHDVFNLICDLTTCPGEPVKLKATEKSLYEFFLKCCTEFMEEGFVTVPIGLGPLDGTIANNPYTVSCALTERGLIVKSQI